MNNNFSGYAINLFFDEPLEAAFRGLWKNIADAGLDSFLLEIQAKPHISLGLFEDNTDPKILCQIAETLAQSTPVIPLRFPAIGGFSLTERMIIMPPCPTIRLLTLHADLHRMLAPHKITSREHYLPDRWIPHCTAAYDVTPENYQEAFRLCSQQKLPFKGSAVKIGISSYPPVKEVNSFKLRPRAS